MRRRLFLGTLLATAAGATARAPVVLGADAFPYGDSHVFAAYRNGQQIGHHALRFREEGGRRHVATSIDITVRMLGMNVYKFSHRCHETWMGDTFQALTAETDDDGKKYAVKAYRVAGGIAVEREGADPMIKTSGGDEALKKSISAREVMPAQTLPSTHWNIAQVRSSDLLHTEYGTHYKVAVSSRGRETVRAVTRSLPATRYDYAGELQLSLWFDDRSRWVKGAFRAHDGSAIEYILQE